MSGYVVATNDFRQEWPGLTGFGGSPSRWGCSGPILINDWMVMMRRWGAVHLQSDRCLVVSDSCFGSRYSEYFHLKGVFKKRVIWHVNVILRKLMKLRRHICLFIRYNLIRIIHLKYFFTPIIVHGKSSDLVVHLNLKFIIIDTTMMKVFF